DTRARCTAGRGSGPTGECTPASISLPGGRRPTSRDRPWSRRRRPCTGPTSASKTELELAAARGPAPPAAPGRLPPGLLPAAPVHHLVERPAVRVADRPQRAVRRIAEGDEVG